MPWQLTVHHEGQAYMVDVDPELDLLSQMREQLPFPLRRACKNGVCTICRCRVIEGQTSYGQRQAHGLWQAEEEAGYILPCIASAQSDLTIEDLMLESGKT